MKHLDIAVFFAITFMAFGCGTTVDYIDQDFPGEEPRQFAKGIINARGRFQQNLTMSASGDEYYITQTDAREWRYDRILRVRWIDGTHVLDTPQFVWDFSFKDERFIGEPMLSPTGDQLFFVADYPPDLYAVKRNDDGHWSPPVHQPFSTNAPDWYPTFSDETLLFTNGSIYKSVPEDGAYGMKERLRVPFNDFDMRDPVMADDNSFVIFTRKVSESSGQTDLFVSFQTEGRWTSPEPLSSDINSDAFEFAPYISPDQRFLFFSRRDSWQNASYSNIYWVDLTVVKKLAL